MTRRSKLWAAAAAVYFFLNALGAGYAVALGEVMHANTHFALLLLGAVGYGVWRMSRARQQSLLTAQHQADPRIEYLQQSVDAVALEVERLGEAQRFAEKQRVERGETPPLKKPPAAE